MASKEILVEILPDGTVKTDVTRHSGSEGQLKELLSSLAKSLGGKLEVEKHVHGAHTHVHAHDPELTVGKPGSG